jgi:hypothetical protein
MPPLPPDRASMRKPPAAVVLTGTTTVLCEVTTGEP